MAPRQDSNLGDRHQLPAVGRGGVLDLAAHPASPQGCLTLDAVHRFTDPEYAELSQRMRSGDRSGEVFDALLGRGDLVVHASDVDRVATRRNDRDLGPAHAAQLAAEDVERYGTRQRPRPAILK